MSLVAFGRNSLADRDPQQPAPVVAAYRATVSW